MSLRTSNYDDHQKELGDSDKLKIATYTSISISIVCSFLVILVFYFVPKFRKFPFGLLFYMTLTCFIDDLLYLIFDIIEVANYNLGFCKFTAFLISFFGLASNTYGTAIACTIVLKTLNYNFEIEKMKNLLHLSIMLISLFFSLIPFYSNSYGIEGKTCWIVGKNDKITFLVEVLSYYILLWIETIIVFFMFIKLLRFYRRFMNDEETKNLLIEQYKTAKRLLAYPLIMIILILLKTIYKLNVYFFDNIHNDDVTCLITVLGNLMGALNCIVFGFTGIIKDTILEKIKVICGVKSNKIKNSSDEETFNRNNMEKLKESDEDYIYVDKKKIEAEMNNI